MVAVPVKAFPNLPAAPLAGKTIIDTCNYGPERDNPDALLVKAFNNIYYKHLLSLARPAGAAGRSYLPIAGDSERAKASVSGFIASIGYNVVDAGRLADSWRQATALRSGGPLRDVLEREGSAGQRRRHPRGPGYRNAVTARWGRAESVWSQGRRVWPGTGDRTISARS
ncbi:hypothetical protein [Amycolatopsis sp. NPDC051071]|uniref:NADPH-dependent F420 reductase n=1 Tax=Amycolatopsis sp. NPDC051071 TaxID=3154637 RepID=UPI0034156F1F